MRKKLIKWIAIIIFLVIVLMFVSLISLCIGSVDISLKKILLYIFKPESSVEYSIISDIRLPRILLAIAVGGALSIAGVILQCMFRNPLVEPYTFGISGGAAVAVSISIILKLPYFTHFISGFIGSIAVISILYFLTGLRKMLRIQELLLTGVMISFICSAAILFIMSVSRVEDIHGIIFWTMGSLEEPNWNLIKLLLGVALVGLIVSYFFWAQLNAFWLGEEEAHQLGINVTQTKKILFLLTSLLTGCCVATAGIIGFVGLVIPHFCRMWFGSDHRILLPAGFLTGAAFLVFCDTLSRTIILPLELPVGVITGIFGGTLFVYLLSRKRNYSF